MVERLALLGEKCACLLFNHAEPLRYTGNTCFFDLFCKVWVWVNIGYQCCIHDLRFMLAVFRSHPRWHRRSIARPGSQGHGMTRVREVEFLLAVNKQGEEHNEGLKDGCLDHFVVFCCWNISGPKGNSETRKLTGVETGWETMNRPHEFDSEDFVQISSNVNPLGSTQSNL